MKFKISSIIFIILFSSCSFADQLLQDKVDSLNSQSIELLGISLYELSKLHDLSPGGHFVPLEVLEGNGDLKILESLEEKGYLTIEEMGEKHQRMLGDIPFNKTDRYIALSEKGRVLFEILQQTSI